MNINNKMRIIAIIVLSICCLGLNAQQRVERADLSGYRLGWPSPPSKNVKFVPFSEMDRSGGIRMKRDFNAPKPPQSIQMYHLKGVIVDSVHKKPLKGVKFYCFAGRKGNLSTIAKGEEIPLMPLNVEYSKKRGTFWFRDMIIYEFQPDSTALVVITHPDMEPYGLNVHCRGFKKERTALEIEADTIFMVPLKE